MTGPSAFGATCSHKHLQMARPSGARSRDIFVLADHQRARAHHARQDGQVDDGDGDRGDDARRAREWR